MNFSNIKDWTIPQGSVTRVTDSHGIVIWEKSGGHDYSQDYFFIEDVSGQSNTVSIKKSGTYAPTIEVFYSTDQTNWSSMGSTSTTAITATVPANGRLYLKARINKWATDLGKLNIISASGNFNIGGNIMSLLYSDDYVNSRFTNDNSYAFARLFRNVTTIINSDSLYLPDNTINHCYYNMFDHCTNLKTAPVLPATTLEDECYEQLFVGCRALTTAPVLPATTISRYCYSSMFNGCTSLTTAPALPATKLEDGCYNQMLRGCTNITTAPALPAETLNKNCYNMMFAGCTALTTAPVLPATTLADWCYSEMFYGCTSLKTVISYAQDISASNCILRWLNGVSATGDFYNLGGATYSRNESGIPTRWTEHNSL